MAQKSLINQGCDTCYFDTCYFDTCNFDISKVDTWYDVYSVFKS